ncbi:GAF domain-containing protein [Nannocystis bainbridge]|uniref:GAF domain-containing protein n=1 Tax=Nannocystis bainbridge TaxID=2995303 RepID=A0ABT5DQ86_9BACT|nr:GAF domain-containing protein [Nannocystis bainbridge]MDC0715826.1 GAF domain-containing protein [Nannocystis bainbridge]
MVDAQRQDGQDAARQRHDAVLLRVAETAAIDAGDLDRALAVLTEAAAEGLQLERASVWVYTPDQAAIECLDLYQRGAGEHDTAPTLLAAAEFPAYFQALAAARTLVAADARTDPATRELADTYLAPHGIGAALEAPIRRRGRLAGVLCNEHVGPARPFSRDEQAFAAAIADNVARALDAADRRRVEDGLAHAKAALEQLDRENRALITRLRRSVERLSTPVLEVWSDVLALPIIGILGEERSAQMTERLLGELARTRARHVILDLTGLDDCDEQTAAAIGVMARAVRLLGAECVLCGVRPDLARAFVDLDLDLRGLQILRDMRHALQDVVTRRAHARTR